MMIAKLQEMLAQQESKLSHSLSKSVERVNSQILNMQLQFKTSHEQGEIRYDDLYK